MTTAWKCGEEVKITGSHGEDPIVMRLYDCCVEHNTFALPEITLKGTLLIGGTLSERDRNEPVPKSMKYKKVIFNDPATIVLWEDGEKTVVKCDPRDDYDPKYGLALCFMKKALGNKSRKLNDVLHKELIDD